MSTGVLVYLRKRDVQSLVFTLGEAFPGAEYVFDVQSRMTNFFGNRQLKTAGMGSAKFQWGMSSAKPIRKWHARIEVVEEFPVFSRLDDSAFPSSRIVKMARTIDKLHSFTIVHVLFGE